MSAIKKWALGGLIACVVGMFVFGYTFFKGSLPAGNILGILSMIVGALGAFGIIVKLPDFTKP